MAAERSLDLWLLIKFAMASGASGLHAGSSQQELFAVIDRLVDELRELRGQRDDHKKDLTEKKSFDKVPTFDGNEKDFTDFEFKFQQFVRPFKYFEQFLDWIKNLDEEPEIGELQHKAQQTAQEDPKVDILWYDEQLYGVLSLITTSTALQTVKNLRDHEGVRGCKAWYQITREVAGRSGVRLERLADRVHHPKPMSSYKEAMARLIEWENDCKELAKLEKQPLSDLTKRTTLRAMLPPDLLRDLEQDSSLKPWSEA